MGHRYSLGRAGRTGGDPFSQFHLCLLGCRNGQQDAPCPKNIDHDHHDLHQAYHFHAQYFAGSTFVPTYMYKFISRSRVLVMNACGSC